MPVGHTCPRRTHIGFQQVDCTDQLGALVLVLVFGQKLFGTHIRELVELTLRIVNGFLLRGYNLLLLSKDVTFLFVGNRQCPIPEFRQYSEGLDLGFDLIVNQIGVDIAPLRAGACPFSGRDAVIERV